MFLNPSQIEELKNVFSAQGLNCNEFKFNNDELGFSYYKITDSRSYRFRICKTIQGALFGDIYCEPYTYMPHIYMSCDNFEDCLNYALEWATVTKYKLAGKTYYHKIFISHSSEDKILIDEFVDKVLRLSCGFKTSEIIYTSQQTTGVKPGENIPQFIKENIANSSIIFFMISPNYRKSEVCLNEMGAAWALDKKMVSILLPNTSFNSLGWLTSFDKAIKIYDSEGLDKLATMLCRKDLDIADWNRQKDLFMTFCNEWAKTRSVI